MSSSGDRCCRPGGAVSVWFVTSRCLTSATGSKWSWPGVPLDFWPEGHNADWNVPDDEPADAVLSQYHAAVASSDAIMTRFALDDPPTRPEDWWADAGLSFPDLRAVLLHVIVETATHAGQLDAVRELLDGKQYLVL